LVGCTQRLIEKFLPVEFDWQPHAGGRRVTVSR